jgi:hypothetical protein
MKAIELIRKLKALPPDLPIRVVIQGQEDNENYWINIVEFNKTGDPGYEVQGEGRLIASE